MQIENFTLQLEHAAGLWCVTSPEIKGLLVAERVMSDALRAVPKALADLMLAEAAH